MGGLRVPSVDVRTAAKAANHMVSETLAFARTSPPDMGLNKFLAELQAAGQEFGVRSTGKFGWQHWPGACAMKRTNWTCAKIARNSAKRSSCPRGSNPIERRWKLTCQSLRRLAVTPESDRCYTTLTTVPLIGKEVRIFGEIFSADSEHPTSPDIAAITDP